MSDIYNEEHCDDCLFSHNHENSILSSLREGEAPAEPRGLSLWWARTYARFYIGPSGGAPPCLRAKCAIFSADPRERIFIHNAKKAVGEGGSSPSSHQEVRREAHPPTAGQMLFSEQQHHEPHLNSSGYVIPNNRRERRIP